MPLTLNNVVPWGRSFAEYRLMFSLSESDLNKRILGCSDGPASFNAELSKKGGSVISVDPVYQFSVKQIKQRIDETCQQIISQLEQNSSDFVWTTIKNTDELRRIRMDAMQQFLLDFPQGKQQGRYIAAELPALDFTDNTFDIALCSHFLFLYSEHFSLDFHIQSVLELARVAREVRIFPLLELNGKQSRHLDPVIKQLNTCGYRASLEKVDYEFQKGANRMLKIQPSPDQ